MIDEAYLQDIGPDVVIMAISCDACSVWGPMVVISFVFTT